MTSNINLAGQFRIDGLAPADTNEATIFTAGEERPTVVELWAANKTASAVDCTIKWGDGSTDYPIVDTFSVPARGYLREACFIPLRNGYTIKVTAGTANGLTFTVVSVSGGSAVSGEFQHA